MWQTAINPVIALELLASGAWTGTGVLGPEAFPATPFLDLLVDHGSPWGMEEREPDPRSVLGRRSARLRCRQRAATTTTPGWPMAGAAEGRPSTSTGLAAQPGGGGRGARR